ncbi:MAG: SprT family zinc-dependent metalloprotease [Lachnospiraceae bacterium]|nr:SprT family zinc-dependent metalloprotease [Lachnospiraceae bacterium]
MAEITYAVKRSDRRSISLEIGSDGRILVRAPRWMPEQEIRRFVLSRRDWILAARKKVEARNEALRDQVGEPITAAELQKLGELAVKDLPPRVARYAKRIGVTYGRITVRNQKTRWGSCSSEGNLNFNCLLMLAPERVRDYVVVHELCHRKQMNHSPRFWAEVAKVMPDYEEQKKWLSENGGALITRMIIR